MSLIKTSRFIGLVLRHKSETIGITLDEYGWANVDELIAGVNTRYPLDTTILEEIVRTDDKQPDSFNEDRTLIRANQRHSIPVDVELEEMAPPQFLWHGTGEKYTQSIEAQDWSQTRQAYNLPCPERHHTENCGSPFPQRVKQMIVLEGNRNEQ